MTSFSDVIGYMAATGTTVAFLPQAWQIAKTRNTLNISKSMYVIFVGGTWLWFAYGLILQSWPVVIANLITGMLSSLILYWKFRYG